MNTGVTHRASAEGAEEMQGGLTEKIISAALEGHTLLGPGLLESVYQAALPHELDLLVDEPVVVEIKAVDALAPIHSARLLTCPRVTGLSFGLLLNFNTVHLRQGIKRVVNTARPPRTSATFVPLR
ncbi:MAG: GxxExxY protein [Polaromonas sp.]